MASKVIVVVALGLLLLPRPIVAEQPAPTVKQEALCNLTCRNNHIDYYTAADMKVLPSMTVCTCKGLKGGAIAVYKFEGETGTLLWEGAEGEEMTPRKAAARAESTHAPPVAEPLHPNLARPERNCPACNCHCGAPDANCRKANSKATALLIITVTSLTVSTGMLIWSAALASQ